MIPQLMRVRICRQKSKKSNIESTVLAIGKKRALKIQNEFTEREKTASTGSNFTPILFFLYREVLGEVEEFAKIRSSLPGSSWMSDDHRVGLSPFYSRSPSASPSRSDSPTPAWSYQGQLRQWAKNTQKLQFSFFEFFSNGFFFSIFFSCWFTLLIFIIIGSSSCFSSPRWSPSSSVRSSPMSEPEERFPDTYSPIENFSDDEENDAAIPESLKVDDPNAITDGGASSSSRNVVSISADNPISPVTKKAKLSPSAYNTFQPVFFPSPPIRRSFSNR